MSRNSLVCFITIYKFLPAWVWSSCPMGIPSGVSLKNLDFSWTSDTLSHCVTLLIIKFSLYRYRWNMWNMLPWLKIYILKELFNYQELPLILAYTCIYIGIIQLNQISTNTELQEKWILKLAVYLCYLLERLREFQT